MARACSRRRSLAPSSRRRARPTADDAQVVTACRAVAEQAGIAYVLATRSEKGMTLVGGGGAGGTGQDFAAAHPFPAAAREVFDVSGAGDTVVAVLAAVLAAGGGGGRGAHLAQ